MTDNPGPIDSGVDLPALPMAQWEPTLDTFHLYAQVVGKIRLASTAQRNHWWNAPLYVTARGLTTRRMWQGSTSFEIEFDLIDPQLVIRTSNGDWLSFELRDGLTVADFYRQIMHALEDAGVPVSIRAVPFGVPMTTPFADDTEHQSFDIEAVRRFWRVLAWSDGVLEEFAGWSTAKTSPVHLFWHSFDLALTRFSGRRVAPSPTADAVTQEAYSHEVISFGFWAGNAQVPRPAYYSYTAPQPEGLTDKPLQPSQASWLITSPTSSLALLDYDVVRAAASPRETLLAFLQSSYEAGAQSAGWDEDDLVTSWGRQAGDGLALDH